MSVTSNPEESASVSSFSVVDAAIASALAETDDESLDSELNVGAESDSPDTVDEAAAEIISNQISARMLLSSQRP
jgi:hypothetical protein